MVLLLPVILALVKKLVNGFLIIVQKVILVSAAEFGLVVHTITRSNYLYLKNEFKYLRKYLI